MTLQKIELATGEWKLLSQPSDKLDTIAKIRHVKHNAVLKQEKPPELGDHPWTNSQDATNEDRRSFCQSP